MVDILATVDARGLSCPEPVLLTQQAMKEFTVGALEVLVSSPNARDNVCRLAERTKWKVTSKEETPDCYRLVLEK